ncbi:U3 small nucleolar RNA-associated protein 14 [Candida viswanathii]|uniref:U3 small nucleolar RNA-associated protein 14 n=1 Tax=Candida viswanathii TaxID=5486 RepID=A0A367YJM4_9ASCO|nr:U3 small nucleolar RNA-associated protein 14 [Candida viswanathii]
MAKKGKTKTKRNAQKYLNAYQIAERQLNGGFSDDDSKDEIFMNERSERNSAYKEFEDGILDARKYLLDDIQVDLDEEIDSDEALGSDDDYDVLNSKFSQTIRDKRKKMKRKGNDEEGDEEEEDDESDGEYDSLDEGQLVTLSEAWDMDDRDLEETLGTKGKKNDIVLDDNWETESSEDEEDEEEEGDSSEESSEEESSEDEEDIFGRPEDNDDDVNLSKTVTNLQSKILSKQPKERKKLIIENREENEFSLPTGGNQLSLQDMMIDGENDDAILIDENSKSIAIPLPKRIQTRNDRAAAYELSKKEVTKWQDTVQANRQAEVLKFPLINQQPDSFKDSAITFRSDNVPTTELEKKINDVLVKSSLVDDSKEATFEEIAVAKLSPEEMKQRTNELRLMRELMFRDEKRAKRIKKIKSKQYHKIQKRERIRNQELVEDSEDEEADDHDVKRATERMSLKHKTQSKWAKSMIKSGLSKDASNRAELEEMLRQGERLRDKQVGFEDGDQSDEGAEDVENEYDHDDEEKDDKLRSKLGKGVMNMDFMKNAEARRKEENMKELEMLKRLENGEGDLDIFEDDNGAVNITKNQGRRVYTPSAATQDNESVNEKALEEIQDDRAKSLANRLSKKYQVVENQEDKKDEPAPLPVDESNPWLTASSSSSNDTKQKSNKVTTIDKESSKLAKAAAKIAKSKRKKHQGDDNVLIDVNETLAVGDIHQDDGSEDEGEEVPTMFKQKDLIKQAFAGDDVVTEFENEKKRVIEDEDDKEEDLTLPGWGDWAGGDAKPKKRKIVRKIDGVMAKDRRKDKNLKNVIINEKVNKKNLKYQSSQVPYGYDNKEQYERSLRMPVGQEWTSKETHQKLTMPRVITKQGTVIDPLKAPFK